MKKIKLVARHDQETGDLGLMVEGTPIINYPMVASEGLLIAHDLLEHVQGVESIGSIGDELLAMGAIWFIRGQHCDIRRGSLATPHEHIAADLVNMGRIVIEGGVPYRVKVPRTKAHDCDVDFQDILNIAKKDLKGELETYNSERVHEYLEDCLHFMRRGYNMAKARYKNVDVNSLFWKIAEEVDDCLKWVEVEGQEFLLTIDYKECYAHGEEYFSEAY